MGKIKVRCTSLGLNPDGPETEYLMEFTGDKNHIESFKSNMPSHEHHFIEHMVRENSFTIPISNYEADPDTLLNVMGMLKTYWMHHEDKLVIETEDAEEWGVSDEPLRKDAAY